MSEVAWAAGFFDGEGSTGVHVKKRNGHEYRTLQVQIGQKDPRPLVRFVELFGGNIRGPYTYRGTGCYRLTYSGTRAEEVIETLTPWLCEPKREQIATARTKLKGHDLP